MAYQLVIGLALCCLAEIALAVVPPLRRWASAVWVRHQGLLAAPGLATAIERVWADRHLAQGLGGLLGLGVGLLLLTPTTAAWSPASVWLPVATTVGGIAVGLAVQVLRAALPASSGPTRVAHATGQTVVGLVGAPTLRLARVTAGLGLVAAGFASLFPVGPPSGLPGAFRTAVLVGLVVLVLVWAAAEWLAVRLVQRPQPAGFTAELAWRDVLRASLVRDIYALPGTTALFLTVLSMLQQESSTLVAPPAAIPLAVALLPLGLMNLTMLAMVCQMLLGAGGTRSARRWSQVLATDPGAGAR